MPTSHPGDLRRFAGFELDIAGYELRGSGRPIRLERQPMDLLIMLVERRGQLVSREDIIERLWGKDVFVDVETGVHTAIRKIRRALRDSPEEPVFIETVSGKGYRFIAPVEVLSAPHDAAAASQPVDEKLESDRRASPAQTSEAALPSKAHTATIRLARIGFAIAAIAVAAIACDRMDAVWAHGAGWSREHCRSAVRESWWRSGTRLPRRRSD
jgi:DNA-binding winged helix-turn-helix (wHTH) protein